MPFPVDEKYLANAETKLGLLLPPAYREKLRLQNGGELDLGEDYWFLFPVLDSSDRKRLKRTCNDVVLETRNSRKWTGFPQQAVAIGHNGSGDKLIFLPDPADPSRLGDALLWWNHETREVQEIAPDIENVLRLHLGVQNH